MAMKNSNNSSDRAYDRDEMLLELVGGGCACASACESSQADYDDSIAEIESMISYSIYRGNEEEVRFWRRMLQKAKVAKRRAKRMIEESRKELSYS